MTDNPNSMTPAKATEIIREKANADGFSIVWTGHAKTQMAERNLLMGDVLHLLREGFVYAEGTPATMVGFFKYCMEAITPNSNGRTVRAFAIPHNNNEAKIKIVTVMWADEPRQS